MITIYLHIKKMNCDFYATKNFYYGYFFDKNNTAIINFIQTQHYLNTINTQLTIIIQKTNKK